MKVTIRTNGETREIEVHSKTSLIGALWDAHCMSRGLQKQEVSVEHPTGFCVIKLDHIEGIDSLANWLKGVY